MPHHDGKQLIQALDSHWEKYQKRLKSCRRLASEEAVHKLRISARRLLALIQLLQALSPQPALGKLRKALKTQLDDFDHLRDTQVMRLKISSAITLLPQLEPFLHQLHLSELQQLQQTPALLHNIDSDQLNKTLRKIRHYCQHAFAKTEQSQTVAIAIDTAYQTALHRYQQLEPSDPASIHRLRIAVKKLRYMLSVAQYLLPELPEDHLQRLQNYLTQMGEIQNSTVLQKHLQQFFTDQLPEAVAQHFHQQQNDLLAHFLQHRNEILQFWRADAHQPYPWPTTDTFV